MKLVVVLSLVLSLVASIGLARTSSAEEPAPAPDTTEVIEAMPLGEERPLVPLRESRYRSVRLRLRSSEGTPVLERGDGEVLSGRAAFLAMGRDDLARRYTWRQVGRYGLMTTGAGLVGYGVYLLFTDLDITCTGEDGPGNVAICEQRRDDEEQQRASLGGVTALAGAGVILVGYLIDPSPVSHPELSRLTSVHNRALRRREGVIDSSSWRLAPTFAGGGLGVGLEGRF